MNSLNWDWFVKNVDNLLKRFEMSITTKEILRTITVVEYYRMCDSCLRTVPRDNNKEVGWTCAKTEDGVCFDLCPTCIAGKLSLKEEIMQEITKTPTKVVTK